MLENLRRSRQARNFTKNVKKILDLKSSSEQIYFRKLSLGAPDAITELSRTLFKPHGFFSCQRKHVQENDSAVTIVTWFPQLGFPLRARTLITIRKSFSE